MTATGDAALGAVLARALDVSPDDPADELTHGFHAYPARMHPWIARRLVTALSKVGDTVLDPFCGSGTVLVEARLAGRTALGADVHPLAVRLARLKSASAAPRFTRELASAASRVAGQALAAARAARGERIPGFEAARAFWQPHVARELLVLRDAVHRVASEPVRDALWLVLSSLAVKVSGRASDTDSRTLERRIAAGAVPRAFKDKAAELAKRLDAFTRAVPPRTPPPLVELRDARTRSELADASVDLVVSSPPYPGIYDYADQHAMRVWLLGLDAAGAAAAEIGARRRGGRGWREGMAAALAELARVIRPGGKAVLLVGDGIEGDHPLDAAREIRDLGTQVRLEPVATAFQTRPTWSGQERRILGPSKRESLVGLVRSAQ